MRYRKCGHEWTEENSISNGASSTRCRTCKRASEAARQATPEGRLRGAQRMAKHRGRPMGGSRGAFNAAKTRCRAGHEYTPENTYLFNGTRQCIACRYLRTATYAQNKRGNGGAHTTEQWLALCESVGNVCVSCKRDRPLTRDHILPVSKGGSSDISNIQPLCRQCNASKKDRLIPAFGGQ